MTLPSFTPRVAVTRDEPADGPLSRALRVAGVEPVSCPVFNQGTAPDPMALSDAVGRMEFFDWVIVTSARAVAALAAVRAGSFPAGATRWAAVGPATDTALLRHGFPAASVVGSSDAESLIALLRDAGPWAGARVFIPRAQEGTDRIAEVLRRLGANVTDVAAYRSIVRGADAIREAWRAAAVSGVIVASPLAARALVGALGATALSELSAVVAIGPTTATALMRLDITPAVPERTTFTAAAALAARLLAPAGRRSAG